MCAAAGATAQTKSAVAAPAADTVLLSETTDGDYIVRRFLVKSRNDTDYSVRYRINLATLNAALSGNSKELDELNAFVGDLTKDTLKQVGAVTITGYSSPDGPVKFNEALAARRANDFKAYRPEVRLFEEVQSDGELRRRGLGDVPHAGRPVVRAR